MDLNRKEYMKKYMKNYRFNNLKLKDYKKFYQIKYKFNLSKEDYLSLLSQQNYKCAICFNKLDNWRKTHIDHNHITQEIRGILCNHCNSLLGYSKEDVSILESAINYLNKNGVKDKQRKEELNESMREKNNYVVVL